MTDNGMQAVEYAEKSDAKLSTKTVNRDPSAFNFCVRSRVID